MGRSHHTNAGANQRKAGAPKLRLRAAAVLAAAVMMLGATMIPTAECAAAGKAASNGASRRHLLQGTAAPGGACGPSVNMRCPWGQCCSQWGYCGTTSSHCGAGCLSSWGSCTGTSSSSSSTTTTTTSTSTAGTAVSGGQCGSNVNLRCPSGECCSQWGWCGTTSGHCGAGCQSSWGSCSGSTTSGTSSSTSSSASSSTTSGSWTAANAVTYHIYDTAYYPNGQVLQGYWPNYNNVNGLYCTDFLSSKSSAYWTQYPWVAASYSKTTLPCGSCVRIRNTRNGRELTARVVDHGGNGFDMDYQRAFKPLDPDSVNWNRGSMDVQWQQVAC